MLLEVRDQLQLDLLNQMRFPNLQRNLMIALAIGLMGGIGLAFFFEHLDDSLKVPQDIVTPYQNSHGSLVPYNSTNQNHVGYLHALENDKQHMSGMPGYSCVASIMTHT